MKETKLKVITSEREHRLAVKAIEVLREAKPDSEAHATLASLVEDYEKRSGRLDAPGGHRGARPPGHGRAAPMWTTMRLPGQQYDGETDLFENWNRYLEPNIGRYLEPEPVLQESMFASLRAEDGASLPVYSYASNNPITRHDNNGLHDTNGCENGSTCDDCAKQAAAITDPTLRACVIAQCRSKNIKLKCDNKSKKRASCGPTEGGNMGGGFDPKKRNEVLWCELSLDLSCQAKLVVHELAHSCKWNDGGGKGVPDYAPGTSPDLDLLLCRPQASGTSGE